MSDTNSREIELSVVMPCLNEAETLATCIEKAQKSIADLELSAEIVVADNGSTDGSIALAESFGARVINVQQRGYGAALRAGFDAADGKYILMADSDDSYDFSNLAPFIEKLRSGADLVMGNRFSGRIEPGAMPWKNRYIGNPILSFLGRFLFNTKIGDFHCGMRGLTKDAFKRMQLKTSGMELASEMVVKAALLDFRIEEVSITLSQDGRSRKPHLRPWRDGWRHLRFLLLFSPRWLFIYPGLLLSTFGLFLVCWLFPGPRHIGPIQFDIHSMIFGSGFLLTGMQALTLGVLARITATNFELVPRTSKFDRLLQRLRFEGLLVLGIGLTLLGIFGALGALQTWASLRFGDLTNPSTIRLAVASMTLLILGVQLSLNSFFLGLLEFQSDVTNPKQ
jgi:hypothetical protein